jgi:hypothetical protein
VELKPGADDPEIANFHYWDPEHQHDANPLFVEARNPWAGTFEVNAAFEADELARILRAKGRSIWAGGACDGSNTYYVDRFGDTPSFWPSSHPRDWLTSRLLPMRLFRFGPSPAPQTASRPGVAETVMPT